MNKIQHIIIASAALIGLTACAKESLPDADNTAPLGTVTATISGTTPTRAAITRAPDDNGYEGVVKTAFVADDWIVFEYYQGAYKSGARLTFDGTNWTSDGPIILNISGANTTVTAAHNYSDTPAPVGGITTYRDHLQATATPASDGSLALEFEHVNALLAVRAGYANGTEAPITNIRIAIDYSGAKTLGGTPVLAPNGAKILSVSYKLNGDDFTVDAPTGNAAVTTARGKSYTLTIDLGAQTPTLDIAAAAIPDWTLVDGRIANTDDTRYIYDADDLVAYRDAVNGGGVPRDFGLNAIQMADIDLSGIANWEPINAGGYDYTGTYNGNGFTIANLKSTGNWSVAGLFGQIRTGAALVDIHLTNVDIRNADDNGTTGGLCAQNNGGDISLCSVEGTVRGGSYVGGLVGRNSNGHITRSRSIAEVTATSTDYDTFVGGVAGLNNGGWIVACMAGGTVGAADNDANAVYTGGLAGYNNINSVIAFSYATATLAPGTAQTHFTGGLAGFSGALVGWSYTTADAPFGSGVGTECWSIGDAARTPEGFVNPDATAVGAFTWTGTEIAERTFQAGKVWIPAANGFPTIDYTYAGDE